MAKDEDATQRRPGQGPIGSPRDEGQLNTTLIDPNADPRMIGRILVESGRLSQTDADRIAEVQQRDGVLFGDAARKLNLLSEEDVQYALAQQFSYPLLRPSDGIFSEELVSAYQPFSPQAEILRGIRSQLVMNWLGSGHKMLAIVSPTPGDGRSYLAANLAVLFAQANRRTLLVDANLRNPRQHEIFQFPCRVGLSALLAGRVRREDLERLPEAVPFFTHLAVLGAGAPPPNPLELLIGDRLPRILNELSMFYDVIIIDTPAGRTQADYQPIATVAHSALLVARKAVTPLAAARKMVKSLQAANVQLVGSVLNDY